MTKPENQVDKQRFHNLKENELRDGGDEKEAIQTAASEVKELRREEGRSKDDEKA